MTGKNGVMDWICGTSGPSDHAERVRAIVRIGSGTHFQWNVLEDSLIHTGRGNPPVSTSDSSGDCMCRSVLSAVDGSGPLSAHGSCSWRGSL